MKRWPVALFLCWCCLGAIAGSDVGSDEPASVAAAFSKVIQHLASVRSYKAAFEVHAQSVKGDVTQTGTFMQVLPFAFRRDVHIEAMGGIMNVFELTVCDGKTGWEVERAPNGRIINVSRWGKDSMEELFYAFRDKALLLMLTHDATNTYSDLRRDVIFREVKPCADGYEFIGYMRVNTLRFANLLKSAAVVGYEAISNFVPQRVRLVVDKNGIATTWQQFNFHDKEMVNVRFTNVEVSRELPPALFSYSPPKDVMILDMDHALQEEQIHVPHPLMNSQAPVLHLTYLSGNKISITPGTQPLVLTFFTTWSGNSRTFIPIVERLYQKYNARGVRFVTVTDQTDAATVKSFADRARLTMPVYLDQNAKTAKEFSVEVIPKVFLIDKNGDVVDVLEGNAPGVERALALSIEKCLTAD